MDHREEPPVRRAKTTHPLNGKATRNGSSHRVGKTQIKVKAQINGKAQVNGKAHLNGKAKSGAAAAKVNGAASKNGKVNGSAQRHDFDAEPEADFPLLDDAVVDDVLDVLPDNED